MQLSKSKIEEIESLMIKAVKEDIPCDNCKELKDQLNAAKSQAKTWETKFLELEKTLSGLRKVIPSWLIEILCRGKSLDELDNLLSASTYWNIHKDELVPHETNDLTSDIRIKIEKLEKYE